MKVKISTYFEKVRFCFLVLYPFIFIIGVYALLIMDKPFSFLFQFIILILMYLTTKPIYSQSGIIKISEEGIEYNGDVMKWKSIREIGVGTNIFFFHRSSWIYFSKFTLTEDERKMLPINCDGFYKIELTTGNLEIVNKYFAGDIKHLAEGNPKADNVSANNTMSPQFYTWICCCSALISLLMGLQFNSLYSKGMRAVDDLKPTDLILTSGTLTAVTPISQNRLIVVIDGTQYFAKQIFYNSTEHIKGKIGSMAEVYYVQDTADIGVLIINAERLLTLDNYKVYLYEQSEIYLYFSLLFFGCAIYYIGFSVRLIIKRHNK